MNNYIQDTIIELAKNIIIKDGKVIATPNFNLCLKNIGHQKVNYLWHILHQQDRSFDGFTYQEYNNVINKEFYSTSLCK